MKQSTLPVSPAFIVKAHRAACAAWKTKLEEMYPSVFEDQTQTFSIGDKVKISQHDGGDYLVAQIDPSVLILIGAIGGNRYNGVKVTLPAHVDVKRIPVMYLKDLSGKSLDNLLLNGKAVSEKKKSDQFGKVISYKPTLTADIELIKSAYSATQTTKIKEMIKDYFPEAFTTGYATLIADNGDSFELSTDLKTIDGIQLTIGNGLAPEGLQYKTITGYANEAEVEVIYDDGGMFHVAFKKK